MERQPIVIGREPIYIYHDEWFNITWKDYDGGDTIVFTNYRINFKGEIQRLPNETIIKVHKMRKDIVVLYYCGIAYSINLEDIIQDTLLNNIL